MTVDDGPDMAGVERHPARDNLAQGAAPLAAGTLIAQSIGSGITVRSREGRTILFGRQAEGVHVCVGADDLGISRQHGVLTCKNNRWWLSNVGRRPVRLPSGELPSNGEPVPLATGYTALFVLGAEQRVHLLEVYIAGNDGERPRALPDHATVQPVKWNLTTDEHKALVVLGQRYLRNEPNPQPLPWQQATDELALIDPTGRWRIKRLQHVVLNLRLRMAEKVSGLVAAEVPAPVGNQLNDNLIRELVRTGSILPKDLEIIDVD